MDMNVNGFLTWILTGGGSIMVVSWILERIPKYQAQVEDTKKYIFFGCSAFISLAAYAVLTYVPTSVLLAIAPYFGILAITFSNVFIGQAFHKNDKKTMPIEVVQAEVVETKNVG